MYIAIYTAGKYANGCRSLQMLVFCLRERETEKKATGMGRTWTYTRFAFQMVQRLLSVLCKIQVKGLAFVVAHYKLHK